MAKLESLIVDLQVNSAQLKAGLDDANKKLDSFDKNLKNLAGVVVFEKFASAAASAISSLAGFTLRGAEAADKMGKLAQSSGITVEEFSRLAYAGELSGVGAEELGGALVKLDGTLSKAGSGAKEQAALFSALGIKVRGSSGQLRSADAVMGDLAERFSGMADGAAKTQIAVGLFGEKGAKLIPMLNAGREGLAGLADEADRFGITVSSGAAASAEAFNDNLAKLKTAATAVGQRVAAGLTPALTTLTDELLNSGEGAEFLKDAAWILSGVLKTLASVGYMLGQIFKVIGKTIARVASAVLDAAKGDFDAARNLVGDVTFDIQGAAEATRHALDGIWGSSDAPAAAARKTHGKTAETIIADAKAMEKASAGAEAAFQSLEKVALSYEAQVQGFGASALDELQARLESGDLAQQLEKIGDKAAEMKERILAAAGALQALKNAKLANELDFEQQRDAARTGAQLQDKRRQYAQAQAGLSPQEITRAATTGFRDFNDALTKLAEETAANGKALADAKYLEANGAIDSAQASLLAADEHQRAAEQASQAADAFMELAKENAARQKEIVNMALGVLGSIGQRGSEVSQLVSSAMQGFQAGGIWGAIIAVIANLFAKLESVGKFIDTAFGNFMDAFSQLNDAFSVLFESLTGSLVPVMKLLGIAFKAVNDILRPIVEVGAQIMEPFAQLATGLIELIDSTGILGFVVKLVAGVFKAIGIVIGGIVLGLQYLWDGVLKMVRGIIAFFTGGAGTKEIDETIAKHEKAIEANKAAIDRNMRSIGQDATGAPSSTGITTTGNITTTGDVIASGPVELKPFDLAKYGLAGGSVDVIDVGGQAFAAGSMAGAEAARVLVENGALMNGLTAEAAKALGEQAYNDFLALGDSAGEAAKQLAEFSRSLTNVPEGFRYAATAYNSTGEMPGAQPFADAGRTVVHVHGSLVTEDQLAGWLEKINRRSQHRRTGFGSIPLDQP